MGVDTTLEVDRDLLVDVLDHREVLHALYGSPSSRDDLEGELDISSATSYRYTNWLEGMDMVESGDELSLTPLGNVVAEEVTVFETDVMETSQTDDVDELLVEAIRLEPALEALAEEPLDRRALEDRLDVSKTTGYRFSRSLEKRGFVERSGRVYELTQTGRDIRETIATLSTNVRTAIRLGPVLEALDSSGQAPTLDEFADANVTTATRGYTHSPATRFVELLRETEELRAFDLGIVVPFDMYDAGDAIQEVDSVEIHRPEVLAELLAQHPGRAQELCDRDNVTVYLHEDLWYSVAVFDDRAGIGVQDPDTGRLQTFVDTGSRDVRAWAESVFESYRREATHVHRVTPTGVRQAIEKQGVEHTTPDDR